MGVPIDAHILPEILSGPESKPRLLSGTAEVEQESQNCFLLGFIGASVAVSLAREGRFVRR
jgi:hypothetical protein